MARRNDDSFLGKVFSLPGALLIGTLIGAGVFWSRQRETPRYDPFAPIGKSFQHGWPYPLWGGTGTVTYMTTPTPTPGSWSLILFNQSDVAAHSDFSSEKDARDAFTALDVRGDTVAGLLDQQGRFISTAGLSAFVYDPSGKVVATLKPGSGQIASRTS